MEKNRLGRLFSRTALLAGSAAYLACVSVNVAGQWFLNHPSAENLNRGMRWDPENPAIWAQHARQWLFFPDTSELQKAADAYLRAASLNPLDLENWTGLADAYLGMGDAKKAEAALRAGLAAAPHSPTAAWRLANLLLLADRLPEAFPYFRTAATYDQTLRFAVFDLAWKLLSDPDVILQEMVPPGVEARQDYFQDLLWRGKLPEAYPVWKEIQAAKTDSVLSRGKDYVRRLASSGMGTEASRVWTEWLAAAGRAAKQPAGELLTDGDFEEGLANGGLEWSWDKGPEHQIALDEFVFQNGTRSLRVNFAGNSNPTFSSVWQLVPVEAGRSYRFKGYLKTENITSDSGPYFSLASVGAPPEEALNLSTESRIGTTVWTREALDFRTGPHTTVILLALRRRQSRKLNNLLGGKAWIDNLSLKPRN